MEKLTGLKVSIVALLLTIMLVVPIKGYAGWVLYDNFNSGSIDWSIWGEYGDWTGADAERYIEDGKLKIILREGPAKSKFGLSFIQNTENIEAIRAKVRIESCTGDGRVKIRGDWIYEHESESQYDFQQAINIYGARGEITAWGDFYVYDTGADIFIDKVSSDNSIDIMGKDFVVTIWFLSDKPKFRVRRLGAIIYEKDLEPLPTERFYVIDVRSWSGKGTCTAYFDNIKVFIDN